MSKVEMAKTLILAWARGWTKAARTPTVVKGIGPASLKPLLAEAQPESVMRVVPEFGLCLPR